MGFKKVMKDLSSQMLSAFHPTMPSTQVRWMPRAFFPCHSLPSSREWVGAMCGLFLVFACCSGIMHLPESLSVNILWSRTVTVCKRIWGVKVFSWAHDPLSSNPLSIFGKRILRSVGLSGLISFMFQLHVHRVTLAWLASPQNLSSCPEQQSLGWQC